MKIYLLSIVIVIACAAMDFFTGYCKAYITHTVKSQKMRIGGVHKLCEIVVMCFICALSYGFDELSKLYNHPVLPDLCSILAFSTTFGYIVIMELVSIFENLSGIFPHAKWIKKICEKLKILEGDNNE